MNKVIDKLKIIKEQNFRKESSVAIGHSFTLCEMIAAYKTVMSVLGIENM